MNLNIIIGHRGTGKSHWLNLIKAFYKKNNLKALFFDLDEEIEKASGQSVFNLFKKGEGFFRDWERKTFRQLVNSIPKDQTCFLSIGAGFAFKKNPSWNVIYLCRHSDKTGRIFFNRPQLNPSKNPFEEYQDFYKKREAWYLKQADELLFRRECFTKLEDSDLLFLGFKKLSHPYFTLRLNPKIAIKNKKQLKSFLQKRLNWGLRFFELNDQTADKNFIQTIRNFIPDDKVLFSSQCSRAFCSIKDKKHWSWDLSLGEPPDGVNILALHDRGEKPLNTLLKEFSSYKYHLKLAVEIFNLEELKTAYNWQCEDPKNRSFLPRSKEGRWVWFRQIFGPGMFLHFIKEGPYFEVLDQPYLSEAMPFVKKRKALGGVLGHPIHFSATPAEQNHFFNKKNSIPVLPVLLKEKELNKEHLKILNDFGFVFFAVTSPLKQEAFLSADVRDKNSRNFKTANTLIFHKKVWRAFNTDWNALQKLKKYSSKDTVVWGGGGIRPVLQKSLPLAQFYSARSGQPLKTHKKTKTKEQEKSFSPKVLIWAVGRKRIEQGCLMPPKHWKPSLVMDINYTEDSPGLEYALKVRAKYQNGFKFFKEQAKKQREIFKSLKYTNPV